MTHRLATKSGKPVFPLIIGGKTVSDDSDNSVQNDPNFLAHAFDKGINGVYFNSGPSSPNFCQGLKRLVKDHGRDNLFIIGNGGNPAQSKRLDHRHKHVVLQEFHNILKELDISYLDVFNLQWIQPYEELDLVLETLTALEQLKAQGKVRYVCASTHNFNYATTLIESSGLLDCMMLRYNMAHKSAEKRAIPACQKAGIPVLAFTTTRWNSLQQGHKKWKQEPPTTADCISYALTAHGGGVITHVINSVTTTAEVDAVLSGMWDPSCENAALRNKWNEYGSLVYANLDGLIAAPGPDFDQLGDVANPVYPTSSGGK